MLALSSGIAPLSVSLDAATAKKTTTTTDRWGDWLLVVETTTWIDDNGKLHVENEIYYVYSPQPKPNRG